MRVPVRLYVKEAIRARSLGILLIDDDQDFTALVRSVLEGKGHGVLELHSGTQGLSKVAEQKPDAAEEHDE